MKIEDLKFYPNIGAIRDIGIVLDFKMLSNVDRDYRWCAKDNHIFIECDHRVSKIYKKIIIEFCGNGLIATHGINSSGIWLNPKIFNINWYGEGAECSFRQFLLDEYQYYLL